MALPAVYPDAHGKNSARTSSIQNHRCVYPVDAKPTHACGSVKSASYIHHKPNTELRS